MLFKEFIFNKKLVAIIFILFGFVALLDIYLYWRNYKVEKPSLIEESQNTHIDIAENLVSVPDVLVDKNIKGKLLSMPNDNKTVDIEVIEGNAARKKYTIEFYGIAWLPKDGSLEGQHIPLEDLVGRDDVELFISKAGNLIIYF